MYIKPETLKNIIIMLLVIALTLCLVSMFSKSKSEGFYGKCATCAQKLADITRSSTVTCRSYLPPGSIRSKCEESNTYSDAQRAAYIQELDNYLSTEPNMAEMCQKNAQLSVCQ
jgi:hypothetical protein